MSGMQRLFSKGVQVAADLGALAGAYTFAFLLRFDWDLPPAFAVRLLMTLPYVVGFQYMVLHLVGIPRFAWRYFGLRESLRVFTAIAIAFGVLFGCLPLVDEIRNAVPIAAKVRIPLGVIVIDACLAFLGITGARIARRLFVERRNRAARPVNKGTAVRTLIVGAGRGGVLVAKELEACPDLGILPVGFIDDDRRKRGSIVHGLQVLGTTSEIADVCAATGAKQALIAISNAPGEVIRGIAQACQAAGISVKIIPGMSEVVAGKLQLSNIRNVAIEDLLRRAPVELDDTELAQLISGRAVLVTGAGGSIGSELCRQICRFSPGKLVLVERSENNLFHVHGELQQAYPELEFVPCIADAGDRYRMKRIFGEHRPSLVLHAAAHKHVPMMEWNPGEAVKNNVQGTRVIADLADEHGVERFVLISTDKAVNPTSVMGATKRMAEMYLQLRAVTSSTKFMTVRFGNVLGSAGSVVPTFKAQIAKGGPVTVTHPEMRRYFMTIPEACQLVLQAGALGDGGEIFILDMGEPVRIVDLAHDLIRLSGLTPNRDIHVIFTGMRPGEKLFEELSTAQENAAKTKHPKIFVGRHEEVPHDDYEARLARLVAMCDLSSPDDIRRALASIVPTYTPDLPRTESEDKAVMEISTALGSPAA